MRNTILVFGIILGSLASCTKKTTETQKEDIMTVEISSLQEKSISDQIEASGVLSSKSEIKLAFKTGGLIKKIYVEEGQSVKAGQLLAELDLSEINATANQAKLSLQKAKRDLDRVKKLVEDEAATETNLLDATTGYEVAVQSVQAIAFNQKLSKIYAPNSGRILRKVAQQGELITPFAPAFLLGTGQEAYILNVGVSDKDIIKLKIGNKASIKLDAYPTEIFTGSVSQIAQVVNPATGTFNIEIEVNANGRKLISGFVAKATLIPNGVKTVLTVPASALVEADAQNAIVFCFINNTAKRTEIKIGAIRSDEIEVVSGLTLTDQVITRGGGFLVDGQKVNVIKK